MTERIQTWQIVAFVALVLACVAVALFWRDLLVWALGGAAAGATALQRTLKRGSAPAELDETRTDPVVETNARRIDEAADAVDAAIDGAERPETGTLSERAERF